MSPKYGISFPAYRCANCSFILFYKAWTPYSTSVNIESSPKSLYLDCNRSIILAIEESSRAVGEMMNMSLPLIIRSSILYPGLLNVLYKAWVLPALLFPMAT